MQSIVDEGGLAKHLENLREQLGKRCAALCEALWQELRDVEFEAPDGGYFVWVPLSGGEPSQQLCREAKPHVCPSPQVPGARWKRISIARCDQASLFTTQPSCARGGATHRQGAPNLEATGDQSSRMSDRCAVWFP